MEKLIANYIEYKIEQIKDKNLLKIMKNFSFNNVKSLIKNDQSELYVIVIGESANRDHMSLYGEALKTTPRFDSIRDELQIFENVRSKYCCTFKALKTILCFDEQLKNGDIVTLFKQAGFKTFWLSNQYYIENSDNITTIISLLCGQKVFVNKAHRRTKLSSNYDGDLVEHFAKFVHDSAQKKVIFVHLLGSHFPYANRYPREFDVFFPTQNTKKSREVARYNNSILYTDYILFKILNIIKLLKINSYLLYFSDHGEDVTEDPESPHCHNESIASPPMFRIPFIIWLSDEYKKLNENFIKNWDLNKQYNTGDVIHSIIDLSRLNCDSFNKNKSIFYENSSK
ncbi:hypothetical protein FACS1894113_1570 [Alphaproteobacteria bacterium]|nr:hypothetical protein FACS1894113_1570 [Alphaproteobacteria bacterium]